MPWNCRVLAYGGIRVVFSSKKGKENVFSSWMEICLQCCLTQADEGVLVIGRFGEITDS